MPDTTCGYLHNYDELIYEKSLQNTMKTHNFYTNVSKTLALDTFLSKSIEIITKHNENTTFRHKCDQNLSPGQISVKNFEKPLENQMLLPCAEPFRPPPPPKKKKGWAHHHQTFFFFFSFF